MKKRTIKGHLHLHRETIRVLTSVWGAIEKGTYGCCEEHLFTYACYEAPNTINTSCDPTVCGTACHTNTCYSDCC